MDTPSSVLYADLRSFGITNRDAAAVLLSDTVAYGSVPPRYRIDEKSFLSRKVVHAKPSETPPLADLTVASLKLASTVLGSDKASHSLTELLDHYAGPACRELAAALDAYGTPESGSYYRNIVRRIRALQLPKESNRVTLLIMLFIIAGSTGDAFEAARLTETFATRKLGVDFGTMTTTTAKRKVEPEKLAPTLALLRIVDGSVKPPLHTLSTDAKGTMIGSFPTGTSTIADVDADVSRQHLRVWSEDGAWYAQDLGSTNGSYLISGADRSQIVIAPPRKERDPRYADRPSAAVPITNSDTLLLGASTRFLVMSAAR